MNIVMTVKNRPAHTYQALRSLFTNTITPWNLVLVNDGSAAETIAVLQTFQGLRKKQVVLLSVPLDDKHAGVIGGLKNMGVNLSFKRFGVSEWLYLSDNDVYFTPGWDIKLITVAQDQGLASCKLFGGQNHPFLHSIGKLAPDFFEFDAVAGTSWLMPWSTWATYGPLDANAPGVQQSEDWAFCNRIRQSGGKVGAMFPPVVWDTGLTQTDGKDSVGRHLKPQKEGVHFI